MMNQFLFTKPRNSPLKEQARRSSSKAMAKRFKKQREAISEDPELMEIEDVRIDQPARACKSSQRKAVSSKAFSRNKRDIAQGKKPVEPMDVDEGSTEEDVVVTRVSTRSKHEPSEEEYFKIFMNRGFTGTRYPHKETLEALGIKRDIDHLFVMSNLSTFMRLHVDAYKEETCHFLASLNLHFYEDEQEYESDGGVGFITFTVRGIQYSLTLKEIDTLFGFEEGSWAQQDFDRKELLAFWQTIADDNAYTSSRSKSAQIRSPVVRYLHKCIASTMFARKTTGNVNEGELKMMDLVLKPIIDHTRDGRTMLGDKAEGSLTYVLLDQLMYYREWAVRMEGLNSAGELSIGGIVTPFLVACGVELISEPYAPRWIDIEHLRKSKFLDSRKPLNMHLYRYTHPTDGEVRLRLPCPIITSTRMGYNVDFMPTAETFYSSSSETSPQLEPNDGSDEEPERYHFNEYTNPKQTKSLREAHKRIGLLQKWNKFQDRTITALKGQLQEIKNQFKDFQGKFSGSSSRKVILPKRVLMRSGSLNTTSRPDIPIDPPRASSYELKQYTRQKTRRARDRQPGESSRLDQPVESARRISTESSFVPTYTRESMEESIDSFFTQP